MTPFTNQAFCTGLPTQLLLHSCSQYRDSVKNLKYTQTQHQSAALQLHLCFLIWAKAGVMVSSQMDTDVGNTKYRPVNIYQLMYQSSVSLMSA